MVSTSGAQLLPHEAIRQLTQHLLPRTTVLTPNIPEANLILSQNGLSEVTVRSADDLESMARHIHALGPKWVLVKGGHCPFTVGEGKVVVDVLVGEGGMVRVESTWQESTSTHGTGCSLACEFVPLRVS
jgi:hydroxymethylpyrimidine/phosphomethylpyrimidine kinase / thiaminase